MNTENPDQTPTTEADAFEISLGHAVTQYRMAEAVAKIRTLEHQRNIVRAEAMAAKDKLESRTCGMLARINDLNAQLSESRSTLRATRDNPRIYTRCPACHNDTLTIHEKHLLCTWHTCPNPTLIHTMGEVTRDADHGAAIEAAAKECWKEMASKTRLPINTLTKHMRALVATVTNSQQKGGEQREAHAAPQPATAKEPTVRRPYSTCPRCDCLIDSMGLCGCDNVQL